MIMVNVTGTVPTQVRFHNAFDERPSQLKLAKQLSEEFGNKPSDARFTCHGVAEGEGIVIINS